MFPEFYGSKLNHDIRASGKIHPIFTVIHIVTHQSIGFVLIERKQECDLTPAQALLIDHIPKSRAFTSLTASQGIFIQTNHQSLYFHSHNALHYIAGEWIPQTILFIITFDAKMCSYEVNQF